MSSTSGEPNDSLDSAKLAWMKEMGNALGVALNLTTPPTLNSDSATSQEGSTIVENVPTGAGTTVASQQAGTRVAPAGDKRVVPGDGGYLFEQHADGKIFIIQSPKHGDSRFEVTDPKPYQAILAQIGPFPETPSQSPPPASAPPSNSNATEAAAMLARMMDAANDTADRMKDALRGVVDGVGNALGEAADRWGYGAADPPQNPTPPPATEEKEPVVADTYRSQRDNPELAAVTCNVTTLAMQLLSLADGDEASLRETAVQLLKDRGVTASTDTQLEELLRQLTIKVGGGTTVKLGEITYKAWEVAWVLDETSELFASYVEKTETILKVISKQNYQDKIAPAVEKGAVILLSTYLTSKGHIVKLNAILDDGLLVDDPYGCLVDGQGAYLENGIDLTQDKVDQIKNSAAVLDQRLKSNASLRKKLSDLAEAGEGKVPGDAGKLNFFTWVEVKTYSIGKWVNITYKK